MNLLLVGMAFMAAGEAGTRTRRDGIMVCEGETDRIIFDGMPAQTTADNK
jgi:hypothetical protein